MKIINTNTNNNSVSFGSFVTHFQEGMKVPISANFMHQIQRLEEEFANHPVIRVLLYDVFSSDIANVGYNKRIIGGSVTVREGYKVPGFKHSDFMVNAPADSDGEAFAKSLRALSTDLEFRFVPDLSSSSNPFGAPISQKPAKPSRSRRALAAPLKILTDWF